MLNCSPMRPSRLRNGSDPRCGPHGPAAAANTGSTQSDEPGSSGGSMRRTRSNMSGEQAEAKRGRKRGPVPRGRAVDIRTLRRKTPTAPQRVCVVSAVEPPHSFKCSICAGTAETTHKVVHSRELGTRRPNGRPLSTLTLVTRRSHQGGRPPPKKGATPGTQHAPTPTTHQPPAPTQNHIYPKRILIITVGGWPRHMAG
jgi:hypothetical protein